MNQTVRAAAAAVVMAATGLASVGCTHTGTACGPTACGPKVAGACGPAGCGPAGCGAGMRHSGASIEDLYRNVVDTTWPEHYNYAARQAVIAPFAQQAANGHFLEQTIWNWHFEPGTANLNGAGRAKIEALARTTPRPDPKVFVQYAQDLPLTAENADNFAALASELTAKRIDAVRKYLEAQPGNTVPYEIVAHNAPTPGIYSQFAATAFRGQPLGYVGGLLTGMGALGAGQNIAGGATLNQGTTTVGGPGTPQGSTPPASGSGTPQ
jgi:hypothetical protein